MIELVYILREFVRVLCEDSRCGGSVSLASSPP